MKQTALAIDLGGTKLIIGEVDRKGNLLRYKKYKSGSLTQPQAMELIIDCALDYKNSVGFIEDPICIGMGLVGRVDYKSGIWEFIDNERCQPIDVVKLMESKFRLPCFIDNDVKAATLAEKRYGSGQDTDNFVYINVGTGIAAGIVCDGKLVRGCFNDAGEIGHMVTNSTSDCQCTCGKFGCVEALASGLGMKNRCLALKSKYPDSPLHVLEDYTADMIFRAAEKSDPLALKVSNEACNALNHAIFNIVQTLNPEKIILGGGVAGCERVIDRLRTPAFERQILAVPRGLVLSSLNPKFVGLIGAATVAFERVEAEK